MTIKTSINKKSQLSSIESLQKDLGLCSNYVHGKDGIEREK